jgi:hypothetical protein
VTFASLSVFPAGTFQYFLLVCGYRSAGKSKWKSRLNGQHVFETLAWI